MVDLDDEIASWLPPPDLLEEISLTYEEQQIYNDIVQSFEGLSPGKRLGNFLLSHTPSSSLSCTLLLEIGIRRLLLNKALIYTLFSSLSQPLGERCISQIIEDGPYPLYISHLESFARRKGLLTSELTKEMTLFFDQRLQNRDNPVVDYRRQWGVRAAETLVENGSQSDALNQFRFYAKKVVQQHLGFSSPTFGAMDDWLGEFIQTAGTIAFDDGIQLRLLMDRAKFDVRFLPLDLRAFVTGQWVPEYRDVVRLREAIAHARQQLRSMCDLCLTPSPALSACIHAVSEKVASGTLRQVFAALRTPDEIGRIEQPLMNCVTQIAARALVTKVSVSCFDSVVPNFACLGRKAPNMWRFKVHPSERGDVSVGLSTPVRRGTFKTVWKVCCLAGNLLQNRVQWPVYAYSKFDSLSNLRKQMRFLRIQAMRASADGHEDQARLFLIQANKAQQYETFYRTMFVNGISTAIALGGEIAVPTCAVHKLKDPSIVKGGAMEYMDGTLQSLAVARLFFEQRLKLAYDVCCLVASMHARHIVHLDLSFANILYAATQSEIVVRLADFDSSKHDDAPLRARTAALPSPEMMVATPQNPVSVAPAMDDWALGLVVAKLLLDGDDWEELIDRDFTPKSANEIQRVLDAACKSTDPVAVNAVRGLLRFNPRRRWTAYKAACTIRALFNNRQCYR